MHLLRSYWSQLENISELAEVCELDQLLPVGRGGERSLFHDPGMRMGDEDGV